MKRFTLLSVGGEERTKELINVALGRQEADLAIVNAKVLNVYTGELLDNYSVAVKGEWIAYAGDDPGDTIGPNTRIIDAKGKTIIPGLIDGHAHLCWLLKIDEFLKYAIKGGTTTIITETMEVFPIMGYEGVIDLLDSLNDQPVKIFGTAPSMVSISKRARGIATETLKKLLSRDDILGLGESYWQDVVKEPEEFLPRFAETLLSGKKLEGHSAGAKGKKLMAYLAPGISSCHEPINAQEVLERLRLGIYVMIREGSIRRDLEAISKIKDSGIDLGRLILVTDGVEPKDLVEKGYMEFVVQKAVDCGFGPADAIRMATINVAEYFSLDGIIGGIAPGKYADMLIVPDPETIKAEYVISKGKVVAMKGDLLVSPRKHAFSRESMNSVQYQRECRPSDFSIPAEKASSSVKVRVIDQVTDLVTKELIVTLPVINGEIRSDASKDILKVAAIDRRYTPGEIFVGLIKGFRLHTGAIACSASWDTSDIIVVGENDNDMAGAVNRIYALQGGAVVYAGGEILSEIPLPVFGIMSDMPAQMLAERMEKITKVIKNLGFPFDDPLLTLVTLTGAAIPFLRICEEGLVNLKDGKTLSLIVE
ncbi:MAG TPA: adenine deaminase C-terminal domain-containing protein [Desulfatiglandales bacterium]|nr:adenine deaminase C-terminal domain-containing protein [Desulfatiglandales bacterium]